MRYHLFCICRPKYKICYYFISFPFLLSSFNYIQNNTQFKYKINDNNGKEVTIVKLILPEGSPSLKERAILSGKKPKDQSLILMWSGGFDDSIIRGCS
uniref:MSP domain-containing protein n=1 Tax=Meloidogyne hapla TaxID=6305 RepID=A0A1I8BG83_MELHA